MRLGLSLPVLPQETLPSFVSYVAQKNGSRHVQDFVQDMNLSWRRIQQLDPDTVEELADLTGTDIGALAANSFLPVDGGFFRLRDSDLPKFFLNRPVLKFCPVCVRADHDAHGRTWGRPLWQIDPLWVCPVHGVLLEALEPPDYPRCPHDFAGRIADHRDRVRTSEAVQMAGEAQCFARYISDRLYHHLHRKSLPWLDGLPIDVAARLCENLGILVRLGATTHPKAPDPQVRAEAGALGFAICAEGPDALWDAYETIRRNSPNPKGGFYTDFGFYSTWLQRLSHRERYRPAIDHFRDFVLESYPLAQGQVVLGKACGQRKWITWAELGRRYGMSFGRMSRFQRAVGASGEDLRRVAPAAYARELRILATGLDRKQAAQKLNIHPSVIDDLVNAGLLRHGIVLPKLEKLFLPEDVDALLASVMAGAAVVDVAPEGSFPLGLIGGKAKLKAVGLLQARIAGQLKAAHRLCGVDGIPGRLLDLAEVLDCFAAAPHTGLTRQQLRVHLHVNGATISLLLKSGLIASTQLRAPRSRRWMSSVAPEELERFLSRYLPLGLMAYELGTQARHVAARLDKANVWPIPMPAHCSKIYLREEAAPIIAI
ncbi:TniQ family protein [Paracoccus sp. (in: a-proteobacteria)]|uniref:TniQ family protein n=1 Tax=Paracoccus sp. TaxID=267 RepID=UPI002AFEBCDA|nr:TniQ family protein [Paracoccus sp. (in: a-proteobacteria)]